MPSSHLFWVLEGFLLIFGGWTYIFLTLTGKMRWNGLGALYLVCFIVRF